MPWNPNDVDRHRSGLSDADKLKWVRVANGAREACVRGGRDERACDVAAIRVANAQFTEAESLDEARLTSLVEAEYEDPGQPGVIDESIAPTPLTETQITELQERVRRDGTFPLKIISPGWGSSGHYSAPVLERHAQMFEGQHMYWDHPSQSELRDRPERSLKDLAAIIENGSTRWQANGPDGPGVYATARVFTPYRESVAELAPYIGVSIRGAGLTKPGEVDGRKGPVVEAISRINSVDFVTRPGAGGRVLNLFEAARGLNDEDIQEAQMAELEEARRERDEARTALQEAQRLQTEAETARDAALQEAARLREANILSQSRTMVETLVREARLPGNARLPDVTIARLTEHLSANPPVAENALDESALRERTRVGIEAEVRYLAAVGGSGRPIGVGTTSTEGLQEAESKELLDRQKKAFGEIGLTETAVEHAVSGRN